MFTIPWKRVHVAVDWLFTIPWKPRSRSRGIRINIKKATLRHWRSQFARHLRAQGVAANATERAVRGESRQSVKDGTYRVSLKGDSVHMQARAEGTAKELALSGGIQPEPGKRTLLKTRAAIQDGWQAVVEKLVDQGDRRLAADVVRFAGSMNRPQTDRERIAREMLVQVRARKARAKVL